MKTQAGRAGFFVRPLFAAAVILAIGSASAEQRPEVRGDSPSQDNAGKSSPRIVLVHPFKNNGPTKYSWLSAALTEAVIADLYRVPELEVISRADRQKARRELAFGQTGQTENMVELGRMLGANLIFTGSYTVVGRRVRVLARLISVETGRVEYSGKSDGTLDKLFELEDRIVLSLLSEAEKIKLPPPRPAAPVRPAPQRPFPSRPSDIASNGAGGNKLDDPSVQQGLYDHLHPGVEPGRPVTGKPPARPPRRPAVPVRPAPSGPQNNTAPGKNRPHPDAYRWYAKGLEVQYTAPALAVTYFDNALDIEPEYLDAIVQAGFTLGNELKFHKEAGEYLDRAEVIFRKRGRRDSVAYARYLRLCGAVYHNQRDYRRGLSYSLRAKRLMEKLGLGRTADYAYVLNNIGNAYYRRKNHLEALAFFKRSQKIQNSAGLGETYKYAILMNNMGAVYNAGGAVRDALFFFKQARGILDQRGLLRSAFGALVLENLGRLYRDHGRTTRALAYFRDARRIRAEIKTAGSRQR